MTQHSLSPESWNAVIIINMINGFTIPHYWKTAEVCVCMQMWRLDELWAAIWWWRKSDSRTGGETPASPRSQHLRNDCVQQECWMLLHTFLLAVHMWPAGPVSEGSTNKGILPHNLPSSLSAFRNVLCDIIALESGCCPAWDSSSSCTQIFMERIVSFSSHHEATLSLTELLQAKHHLKSLEANYLEQIDFFVGFR